MLLPSVDPGGRAVEAEVCRRLISGIAVSNLAESLVSVARCAGSGLCDGLITRSEESYRVCECVIVCDHTECVSV